MDRRNGSLFPASGSHDQDSLYAHICLKPLETFFYGAIGPMALGLSMQHWGHEPNKV